MLVLSRKNKESIMLGDDIEIIVLGIHGCHRVQIGIEAPANVTIKRKEIHDAQRGETPEVGDDTDY